MNRKLTNSIRYVMDEFLPRFIRDSYWFMYPVFFILYKGKDINRKMHFKTLAQKLSEQEVNALYKEVDVISRNRKTDLTESNIKYVLNCLMDGKTILDAGCGKGYLLSRIQQVYPNCTLDGLDLDNQLEYEGIKFTKGSVTSLPFPDNAFDIVLCTHMIEHIIPLERAIAELIRVAQKKLIIVTPCQRYFYYTLDGHVNFFYKKEELTGHLPFNKFECKKLDGDWIYVGEKT
jgi:ubiquinone/menaquinone biosynthesis C-methylase UbiE